MAHEVDKSAGRKQELCMVNGVPVSKAPDGCRCRVCFSHREGTRDDTEGG